MTTRTGITALGHVGVWVYDLDAMRHFYVGIVGLHVTDEDAELGMVFLSAQPDQEHHELVLQRGRLDRGQGSSRVINQISWRLDSLDALQEFDRRFLAEGVRVQQKITHGNALGIYFLDPEDNVLEVYWATGEDVPQPFRKSIELSLAPDELLTESRRLVAAGGNMYQPVRDGDTQR